MTNASLSDADGATDPDCTIPLAATLDMAAALDLAKALANAGFVKIALDGENVDRPLTPGLQVILAALRSPDADITLERPSAALAEAFAELGFPAISPEDLDQ